MKSISNLLRKCRVCGDKTRAVCNIDFKAVPLCDFCSNAIFIQQASYLALKERESIMLGDKK